MQIHSWNYHGHNIQQILDRENGVFHIIQKLVLHRNMVIHSRNQQNQLYDWTNETEAVHATYHQ
jgi:hypothetical protein